MSFVNDKTNSCPVHLRSFYLHISTLGKPFFNVKPNHCEWQPITSTIMSKHVRSLCCVLAREVVTIMLHAHRMRRICTVH